MTIRHTSIYRSNVVRGLCLLCVLAVGPGVLAQEKDPTGGAGTPTPVALNRPLITTETYTIAVEDVIEISVLRRPELSMTVQVLSDGTIDYPYIGTINVVGMTLGELKKKVRESLTKRYVNPRVTAAVRSRPQEQISLIGALSTRGKVAWKLGWKVRDVIGYAGGVTGSAGPTDRYELYKARLIKAETGEVKEIDLYKLLVDNDRSQNYSVEPNDTLEVYLKDVDQIRVQVIGQVRSPGPVEFPRTASLIDVLTSAGGPLPSAALSKVEIRRGTQAINVDMRKYGKEGFDPEVKLKPGDVVSVPENKLEYKMLGAFPNGGTRLYPDDKVPTLVGAIAGAGGRTDGLELKKTRIVRRREVNVDGDEWKKTSEVDGSPVWTRVVNVEEMLKSGDRTNDIAIVPDDEIWVKQSGGRRAVDFNQVWLAISAVTGLVGLWRLFQ
ncbi:MAG: hypothetical protein OHK0029_38230 [Armatimonadaceae bacterium]